ncbi:MAG TPA: right-handed parallel beta-helix repeat-containing protein [Candidatus Binatia bacterium]|nr:right-handed parallel beta-helix repeat-containing protein [Candidatus Binatia bacterium]
MKPQPTDVNYALLITVVVQLVIFPGCGDSKTATDLYVAASGSPYASGSAANPYRRITDAVARARAERATAAIAPDDEIRIHVAPGMYVGSFDAAEVQEHREYEVLPIILNIPRLTLLGSTVLTRDERGLATETLPGSESIVAPDVALRPNQYLVLVTRTADGSRGDGVTLDGFVFDGKLGDLPGAAVFIDRVSEFRFTNNVVERSAFGVMTRLASGTIERNLLADNLELGSILTGGSRAQPATVLVRANRITRNAAHGISGAVGGWVRLVTDAGGNSIPLLEPLQTTFDRNNPADADNIPDTLNVTLDGNDVSDNGDPNSRFGGTGIRLVGIWPDLTYTTTDSSQPVTSSLVANVVGNTCDRNGAYGVAIEAGDTQRSAPRRFIQSLAVNFERNIFIGNDRAPALFTFTYWLVSFGTTPQISKKFAEASTFAVSDTDGELVMFDYDNPVTDPVSGAVLNNTLTLNGVEAPQGKSITP